MIFVQFKFFNISTKPPDTNDKTLPLTVDHTCRTYVSQKKKQKKNSDSKQT